MKEYKCWCYNCLKDMTEDGWPIPLTRMILCPDCGNKRCPKATDHNNACTNSNEPGQPGSRYTDGSDTSEFKLHDSLLIKPTRLPPDPLVVVNAQSEEIFRITKDGDIYSKGRLIQGDKELVEITKEFMRLMIENMRQP